MSLVGGSGGGVGDGGGGRPLVSVASYLCAFPLTHTPELITQATILMSFFTSYLSKHMVLFLLIFLCVSPMLSLLSMIFKLS